MTSPAAAPDPRAEPEELRRRLEEAEQTLAAIRSGAVDALVVDGPGGPRVYTLEGEAHSYRVLVENINEGVATLAADGLVLWCNRRFAELLGRPLPQVMGGSFPQWVAEASRAVFDALVRDAAAGAKDELSLVDGAGHELPVLLSLSLARDGDRPQLCLVATDLRERRRLDAIVEAERLARSVLEQAAEAIVVCDAAGTVIRASASAARLCGRNPLRLPFDEAFPLRTAGAPAAGLVAAALQGGTVRALPVSLAGPGAAAELLASAAPLRDAQSAPAGCIVSLVDVTEGRRAERRLHAEEQRLLLAVEAGRMATWEWDVQTGKLLWNHAAYEMYGYEPGRIEATYEAWWSRVHPEDRPNVEAALQRSLATGEEYRADFRVVRPDGSVRWTEAHGRVEREGGRAVRVDGVSLDVTEHKLAEEVLRTQDRRKNEFLAVLSHELRNPLAPMTTAVYVLEHAAPADDQGRRSVQVLRRQVAHLTRLVDELLEVSRIERGKVLLRKEPVALAAVVSAAVEDLRPSFEAAGVGLSVSLPGQPLLLVADRTRLAQVVGNLLGNAAKFTPAGGQVAVRLEEDAAAGAAVLRVRDTGAGLSPDMLSQLFVPFAQADRTLARAKGGLGLGLAIVKGLVEMHGGSVQARSEGPGRGSEFVVRLPLGSSAGTAPRDAEPARVEARRVLVVEDNADAAQSLAEALELDGHEVHQASGGREGLQKAAALRPDVVLCDIGLPDLDGYEVAKALRADESLRGVVLVALTGYGLPEDVARASEAGFDRHLVKPPDLALLARVLAQAGGGRGGPGA